MTFILHLIRWQGLRLGSTRLDAAYLFECILKILKLDNCIAVVVAAVVVAACVVMVHDPVAKVWRAYANCGNKTVKISMPVAGNGTAKKGKGTRRGLGREKRRAERRRAGKRTHSMGLRAWQGMALRRVDSQTICWNKFEIEWNCQKHFAHFATASDAKKKPRKKKNKPNFFCFFSYLPFPPPACRVLGANLSWRLSLIPLHASGIFALLCTRVSYGFNKAKTQK